MERVYVVSSYGRPIAAFDESADAMALADAIYGDSVAEHVYEVVHMADCKRETIIVGSALMDKLGGDADAE